MDNSNTESPSQFDDFTEKYMATNRSNNSVKHGERHIVDPVIEETSVKHPAR